ncbi:MAG TPA: hypothetical protein VF175_01685, partial [Lacipirellula sp.]
DADAQEQAFQFGFSVAGRTTPFVAKSSVLAPFAGQTPQPGQEMGLYLGTGDQDNYIQIVVSGDNGGSVKVMKEFAGVFTTVASHDTSLPGAGRVELFLTATPQTKSVQASYSIDGGPQINIGAPVAVPVGVAIPPALAAGIRATDPTGSGAMPVTWDYLGVTDVGAPDPDPDPDPGSDDAQALVFIEGLGGDLQTASVFGTGSFRIANRSTGDVKIQSVTIDSSTAIMPDVVFDPLGDGGNDVFKAFTPDEGAALTGLSDHAYIGPHGGGFDELSIDFNDFDPGEEFVFSIDMEPTSIKGSVAPGPSHAGKVSGMEMTGATVTVVFNNGATTTSRTFRTAGNNRASQTIADTGLPPTPGLALLGSATSPGYTSAANHTVRITGPAGAKARLLHIEASLHLAGVPGGGFDIDPFEANKATKLVEKTVTIGAGGFVDVPIVLTKSEQQGGYNYITAAIQDAQGRTGDNAAKLTLAYNVPPHNGAAAPLAGDYDADGSVDGRDFIVWQRTLGSAVEAGAGADGSGDGVVNADDLAPWQENFGASSDSSAAAEAPSQASTAAFEMSSLWEQSVNGLAAEETEAAAVESADQAVELAPLATHEWAGISALAGEAELEELFSDVAEFEMDAALDDDLSDLDVAFATIK